METDGEGCEDSARTDAEGREVDALAPRNIPHCVATFGFGGLLVTCFPGAAQQQWSTNATAAGDGAGGDGGAPTVIETATTVQSVANVLRAGRGSGDATGACGYNRPRAHQYVGKSQSCML